MKFGIRKQPFLGIKECGDRCFIKEFDGRILVAVIDGLGHGRSAEMAAVRAVEYIEKYYDRNLSDIFHGCDALLKETVGAAMGIALIDPENRCITFAGVGNITARVVGDRSFSLVSDFGIVGAGIRKIREETYPLNPGNMLIMHSDGISERFDVLSYPREIRSDPHRLAEAILNEFSRPTDDSIIVVGS